MIARARNWILKRIARRKYRPSIEVRRAGDLVRLGSKYGGWTMEPAADLQRSTIISCGLGEDASFDVEIASRFDAKVIIVDPTPRAILHFGEIQKRIGQPAIQGYVRGGRQPTTSYDLSSVAKDSLILEPLALWVEITKLKFFAPPNPDHVSHSIINFQNNYSQSTAHIEVPTITPEALLEKYQLETVQLMKLDIEGAEVNVIKHMLEKSILPRQILIEFDELNVPSTRAKTNAEVTDKALRQAGYACRYFDGLSNFLYTLRSAA